MANLVLGTAGAVVGGFIGGPFGAQIGWALGSTLGSFLDRPKAQHISQPLADLRVPGAEYGQPIPWLRGAMAMPGQYWWNSDKLPTYSTETTGGKGGEPEVVTTTITYSMDVLIGLTSIPIVGVGRIWENGEIIRNGIAATTIDTEHWDRLTVYTGSASQLPDPDYEAAVGAGNAPAYRDRGSLFIQGLKLGQSGQLRHLVFEVIVDGVYGAALAEYFGAHDAVDEAGNYAFCAYDTVNDVVIFAAGASTLNGSGGLGQFGVFDAVSKTFLTPIDPYVLPDSETSVYYEPNFTTGALYSHLTPSTEKLYLSTSKQTLIYDVTTREYVADMLQSLPISYGSTAKVYVLGIDTINNHILLGAWTVSTTVFGVKRASTSDGIPTEAEVIELDPSFLGNYPAGRTRHLADASGDYWSVSVLDNTVFRRMYVASEFMDVLTYSAGADKISPYPSAWAYDSGRDAIYYFSEDMRWVKRLDCVTGTNVRVNAVAFSTTSTDPTYMGDTPNTNNANASITYDIANDRLLLVKGTGATVTLNEINASTGALVSTINALSDFPGSLHHLTSEAAYDPSGSALYATAFSDSGALRGGLGEFAFGTTPGCISVATAQAALCERAGLAASQYDVTALTAITRTVCSRPWTDVAGARELTEALMAAYFYEITVNDKIRFVPRGGAPVATITHDELGAGDGETTDEPALVLRQVSDLEFPAKWALSYINISNDYQNDTQPSDRLVSESAVTTHAMSIPLGMTPTNAKIAVDAMAADQAASVWGANFATLGDRCAIEPCDVVLVNGIDDSQYRMRIVRKDDTFPLLAFEAVLDQASVLNQTGTTSIDYTSSTVISSPVRTDLALLDIPILRDADNNYGYYLALKGWGTPWPGGTAFVSSDNVSYAPLDSIFEPAIFGRCTTTLGDWTGSRMFDELNTVTVNVWPGTLTSNTRDNVLGDQSINAMAVGNELIQFLDATLVSEGVYRLSRLLRGSRGTEWAMEGHASNEQCVLLRTQGLRRVLPEGSSVGLSRYYKAVTLGRSLATTTPMTFTNNAIGLKPFSLFDLRANRDDYDTVIFTMQRRSRLSVRVLGALGINVPLGEDAESYELDILSESSDGGTVVRTITSSSLTIEYTATQQATDGLVPGEPIHVRAYQVSATVGRGYILEDIV